MKRFVVHFHLPYWNEPSYEEQINNYAETNNLTIVQIAPLYGNGIFVLFEEKKQNEEEWLDNLYCSVCGYCYKRDSGVIRLGNCRKIITCIKFQIMV